jgi:ABC-type multidrug transport system ATPase subunit
VAISVRVHVELREVSKQYESTPALDAVSLTIPPGHVVSVIGLNGAGKTTLLRCLSGIVAPSRGTILYNQRPFHRERLDLRRELMFLPDFPAAFLDLNVLEHISQLLRIYARDTSGVAAGILRTLGELDLLPLAEAPLATLSRGQIYKCALAGLFAVKPELWLLDEPFASGLDPQGLAVLKQAARHHASSGGTVIYTTQILEIAERFADRLIVIDRGRVASTFNRLELDAMPASGPESLESRLRQFREVPTT